MKGGKHTALEKCGIAVLGLGLWIVTAALGCAIVFDLWIIKDTPVSTSSSALVLGQQWLIGLWKSCLIPKQNPGEIVFYWPHTHNCTAITDLSALTNLSQEGDWNIELQLLALVSLLASALMTVLSHMFYFCGYIPNAKRCKICGLGGLPAVLVTSGAFQICSLVVVFFLSDQTWSFGLSYYIVLGSVLPTWIMGIATLIVTCRIS